MLAKTSQTTKAMSLAYLKKATKNKQKYDNKRWLKTIKHNLLNSNDFFRIKKFVYQLAKQLFFVIDYY